MIDTVSAGGVAGFAAQQLATQSPLRELERRADTARANGAGSPAAASSTQVQLSEESRLRAANDAVATAARNVQQPTEAPAVVASDFVNAANTQNRIANEVSSAAASETPSGQGAAAASGDVRRASETQAALAARATELAQIGIERQDNGNLRLDAQALEQAATRDPEQVAATLARAGRDVAQAVAPAADEPPAAPPAPAASGPALTATTTVTAATPVQAAAAAESAADTQPADNARQQAEQAQAAERQQARVVTQNPFLVGAAATYRSVGDI